MALNVLNTGSTPIKCDGCYLFTVTASDYISGTTTFIYGYTDRYFVFHKLGDIGTITADGTTTFNIDIPGDLTEPVSELEAQCNYVIALDGDYMSNFAIQYNDDADVTLNIGGLFLDPTCDTQKRVSDCLDVADSCDCGLKIEWSNDNDAFGFNYSGFPFTQTLRVPGVKWFSRFPGANNQYTGSTGITTIVSADSHEIERVRLDELPRSVHKALRLGLKCRDFKINGVNYVALPEEYEPDWDQFRKTATVQFEVRKSVEDNENNNC